MRCCRSLRYGIDQTRVREYGDSTVINCSERYVLEIPDKEYPLRQHGQVIWKTRYRDPYPEE